MSLDVYLVVNTEKVYSGNITHNLGCMAEAAGLYEVLWRPYRLLEAYKVFGDYKPSDEEEYTFEDHNGGRVKGVDLIPVLETGLATLKADPNHYKQFNPFSGWGDYEGLVLFVEEYLEVCKKYPDATIFVSR